MIGSGPRALRFASLQEPNDAETPGRWCCCVFGSDMGRISPCCRPWSQVLTDIFECTSYFLLAEHKEVSDFLELFRRSSELMSVQGHKSYYYNVFGNIDERFDNALKARKQEERTALAIHSFPGASTEKTRIIF